MIAGICRALRRISRFIICGRCLTRRYRRAPFFFFSTSSLSLLVFARLPARGLSPTHLASSALFSHSMPKLPGGVTSRRSPFSAPQNHKKAFSRRDAAVPRRAYLPVLCRSALRLHVSTWKKRGCDECSARGRPSSPGRLFALREV